MSDLSDNHRWILKLILNPSFHSHACKIEVSVILVLVYQPLCFVQFFVPEDGQHGPKHVVNKHRRNCVDCICDHSFFKQEHKGIFTSNVCISDSSSTLSSLRHLRGRHI